MRKSIRKFVELVSETLPVSYPLYEFGSYQVEGQQSQIDLRPLFTGGEFIGADMREGPGVDVILDLHKIDLPDDHIGTILTFDTFEHVEYPHRAIEEIYRVLKPGGKVVFSSVMRFPIHDFPSDYWRFTPAAFESLLKPFDSTFVGYAGYDYFPHTVVGIGFKGSGEIPSAFHKQFVNWQKSSKHDNSITGIAQRLLPPLIMDPLLNRIQR
jgi:SAM-dependent methyltransferase